MRKQVFALVLLSALALAGAAGAITCTVDEVPAATLLLPYFEVDLNHPNGVNTTFSVNNSNATAVLAHVVLWSDLSVPVLDFNMYLTGYDMQVISLRDILVNGTFPQTASAGQDPTDTISPRGFLSQDINFASCTGQLPPPPVPASFITYLQAALTGRPAALVGNKCLGRRLGDHVARGYVTVDVVNNCTLRFPTDVGYFGPGGTGDAVDFNVLWGDYAITNHAAKAGAGGPLVHIEADPTNPQTTTAGNYTFYGRYVNWTAADNREPLATRFGVRYSDDATSSTDLLVWRDSKVSTPTGFACPAGTTGNPAWYPLPQEDLVIFDEQEQPVIPGGLTPFPAEAQRVAVNSPALPVPYNSGWMVLGLNASVPAAGANPPIDPAAAQAFVTAVTTSDSGLFTIGYPAVQLDSACNANHTVP